MHRELSERNWRRESLQKLLELGINPYPSELFEVNVSATEIRKTIRLINLAIRISKLLVD